MIKELKSPRLDPITNKWFVQLEDESGYLNISCTITHDSRLRRENLNQVYFETEHAAHLVAAAYYLGENLLYPYESLWDACTGKEPNDGKSESTVMEFI